MHDDSIRIDPPLYLAHTMVSCWRCGDIWIHRPTGGDCRGGRLTKGNLMMDIAADFGFFNFEAPEYTAGRPGRILNSSRVKNKMETTL